jgi:hypothetical protein
MAIEPFLSLFGRKQIPADNRKDDSEKKPQFLKALEVHARGLLFDP